MRDCVRVLYRLVGGEDNAANSAASGRDESETIEDLYYPAEYCRQLVDTLTQSNACMPKSIRTVSTTNGHHSGAFSVAFLDK
jgi:hypothetical protein